MADIPLIRVEGKRRPPPGTPAAAWLAAPDARLERAAKGAPAREAEAALGLPDALYFYFGHASPGYGDIVLVYEAEAVCAAPGTATPFDSGRLHGGEVPARDMDEGEACDAYVRRHRRPLSDHREQVDGWVDEHFTSRPAYVLGEAPVRDDESGRLRHPRCPGRLAWTWEAQVEADHPLRAGLRLLGLSNSTRAALLRELRNIQDPELRRWWADVLRERVRVAQPTEGPGTLCGLVEQEVAGWL